MTQIFVDGTNVFILGGLAGASIVCMYVWDYVRFGKIDASGRLSRAVCYFL